MFGDTKSSPVTKLLAATMAVPALAAAGIAATATPAAAEWDDCWGGFSYNCFWSGSEGTGARTDIPDSSDDNIGAVSARSGYNITAYRACAFTGTGFTGSLNYNRPSGDTESYSQRTHKSLKYVSSGLNCPVPV